MSQPKKGAKASTGFYGRTYDGTVPFYGKDPAPQRRMTMGPGQRLETPVAPSFLTRNNVDRQNWTWSKAHMLIGDKDDRKKYTAKGDPLEAEDKLGMMQGWEAVASQYAMQKLEDEMEKMVPPYMQARL